MALASHANTVWTNPAAWVGLVTIAYRAKARTMSRMILRVRVIAPPPPWRPDWPSALDAPAWVSHRRLWGEARRRTRRQFLLLGIARLLGGVVRPRLVTKGDKGQTTP